MYSLPRVYLGEVSWKRSRVEVSGTISFIFSFYSLVESPTTCRSGGLNIPENSICGHLWYNNKKTKVIVTYSKQISNWCNLTAI